MDLNTHAATIDGFNALNDAERIRFFAWFLHARGKAVFEQADITACYKELGLVRPNVGPYLKKMVDRKPPELLRSRLGYQLERRKLDELSAAYGARDALVKLDRALNDLIAKITNQHERVFFDEMMVCVRHGAFRAAVVMAWNLAYWHLCDFVFTQKLVEFNAQLPQSFSRANIAAIANRDDFAKLQEWQVVQVCKSAGITTADVDKILTEKLARRNSAAHPSSVVITQLRAEETIVDLVENIVLRF